MKSGLRRISPRSECDADNYVVGILIGIGMP